VFNELIRHAYRGQMKETGSLDLDVQDELVALGHRGTEDLNNGLVHCAGEELQLHGTSAAFDDIDPHKCHRLRLPCS
jgi:hypothetical protein